jgi:hypothetical protein
MAAGPLAYTTSVFKCKKKSRELFWNSNKKIQLNHPVCPIKLIGIKICTNVKLQKIELLISGANLGYFVLESM